MGWSWKTTTSIQVHKSPRPIVPTSALMVSCLTGRPITAPSQFAENTMRQKNLNIFSVSPTCSMIFSAHCINLCVGHEEDTSASQHPAPFLIIRSFFDFISIQSGRHAVRASRLMQNTLHGVIRADRLSFYSL